MENFSTPKPNNPLETVEAINPRRAFWAAIVFTFVAFVSFIFALFLIASKPVWQVYAVTAITVIALATNLIGLVLVRRGQPTSGLKYFYWSLVVIVPLNVLLVTNTTPFLIGIVLVVGFVHVFYLLPRTWRKYYQFGPIIAAILMITVEFVQPAFRLNLTQATTTSGYFGETILVFLTISLISLIIGLGWKNMLSFLRTSVRNRLTAIVVGAAIIPVLAISIFLGVVTYVRVRGSLIQTTFDRLDAIEEIKTNQLSNYMDERADDMVALSDTMGSLLNEALQKMQAINTLKRDQVAQLFKTWDADVRDVASDPGVVDGMANLTVGFQSLGDTQARSLYLGKTELENAGDESVYSAAHFEQHGFFSGYADIHGYEDAFLIDPNGNVVYSIHKSDVFATNLLTGTYKDSNLAKLYKNLISAQAGTSYIADVAPFDGSYAMFIGAPIYDGSILIGMLAYRLPVDAITNIMAEKTGQGDTGETFLIAMEDDGRITYRSDRTTVGNGEFVVGYDITQIASQSMRNALDGKSGGKLIIGSTGEARINAYRPLEIEGLNWAVFTSVSAAEALSPIHIAGEKDFLSTYKEDYGYNDIFLVNPDGFIFYTVSKKADYLTNLLTGEFNDSNLASLVGEVLESKSYEFADFAYYAPSGGAPAAFFGIPVVDPEGNVELIVAAQVAVEDINQIMNEAHGLGETGETYIIGSDFLGRMDSRFIDQMGTDTTVLNPYFTVYTEAGRSALAGESGQGTIINYRGIPVMSVWKPFKINETKSSQEETKAWAVITEIDTSEAFKPINQLASTLGLLISVVTLVIGGLAVFLGTRFATGFVKPILSLTDTATQVAAGDLSLRVAADSEDEIGTLTTTFNNMTAQLQDTLEGLEQRVAARTKDLATVARISTVTATIRDPFELLANMVHLTQRGFDLYHAHVFVYRKNTDDLQIVACGYKEGDEHEGTHGTSVIPMDREQSLVARAARTRQPVIVNDVRSDPGWLPNPLLPDTHAELAVPMIVGDELLGVLDVQAEQVDAFSEEDANIQMTLASQVATALQNAQSYAKTQKQAELESMVNLIGQRIQRTTSIEETLRTAIRELGTAIGASRVKASLRSTTSVNTLPIEPGEPVLVAEAERKNGSDPSDLESTLAE